METNLGGSLLPCCGQEAPQSALDVDWHKAERSVNSWPDACAYTQLGPVARLPDNPSGQRAHPHSFLEAGDFGARQGALTAGANGSILESGVGSLP